MALRTSLLGLGAALLLSNPGLSGAIAAPGAFRFGPSPAVIPAQVICNAAGCVDQKTGARSASVCTPRGCFPAGPAVPRAPRYVQPQRVPPQYAQPAPRYDDRGYYERRRYYDERPGPYYGPRPYYDPYNAPRPRIYDYDD